MDSSSDTKSDLLKTRVALPQYRQPLFDGRTIYFTVLAVVLAGGLAAVLWLTRPAATERHAKSTWTADQQREFANRLREFLPARSAAEFEKYLAMAQSNGHERANVDYTVAKTAVAAGDYETALAYYYKAEIAEPKGSLSADIGSGIVTCLEKLGKYADAQIALDSRAGLGARNDVAVKGEVVAKIGSREITTGEIDNAIQKMPPWAQQQYSTPDKKAEFLHQYIADELLYEKAQKQGLDKDPDVRSQVEEAARRAAVGKLIQQEVRDKIQVRPEDVRMYYDAHKDEFREKARARVRHIVTKTKPEKQAPKEDAEEIKGWVVEGGSVPGIKDSQPMVPKILATDVGGVTEPIKDDAGWHVFYIEEKKPARQKPFDEVKAQAEQRYRAMKEQEEYKRLIDTTLQAHNVEMFPEKFGDASK